MTKETLMETDTPKYATLKALQAAYASGELNRQHKLMLDNDAVYLYVREECVYRGEGPHVLIEEALDLLNIPWESA